jgi:hypothetical protein
MSFSPTQIADEIRKSIPEFKISYTPDYRQEIADSWPKSINDASAKEDWNWTPDFDLATLTNIMLENIS